jgi:cyclophilin family peptidyl-prolyl cis-trans isomerase
LFIVGKIICTQTYDLKFLHVLQEIGTVAMASAGENLNASQFYITTAPDLVELDDKHTIFGRVAEGLETLKRVRRFVSSLRFAASALSGRRC